MTVLLPWFALVVTILAGWAIIKRLSTSMVLLFAGLAMISFAVICGRRRLRCLYGQNRRCTRSCSCLR